MSYYNRNSRHPRDRNNKSRHQNYDDVNNNTKNLLNSFITFFYNN